MEASSQPVYLNALGMICALGKGKKQIAQRLFQGDPTGVIMLENACVNGQTLPFAPVQDSLPELPEHLQQFASRNFALVLAALAEIDEAVHHAIERFSPARIAVVMGTSTSGISVGEALLCDPAFRESGELPAGFDFLQQEIGSTAESLAAYLGVGGPAITVSTACSSGAKALGVARRLLRQNLADAVVAGGCDSQCALTLNGFQALAALSPTACRPFSANRDGTMIGEGAALFLVTKDEAGVKLSGIGESSDAHNMTAPQPAGEGAIQAMHAALADAQIAGSDLDYVNLHGTATRLNDAMESRAIDAVLHGEVPCSSSKAQLGHTLGAAGAIEAAVCWLTLQCNPAAQLPPHLWDGAAAEDAPLPSMVRATDRLARRSFTRLMSNSYAFGGNNASIILEGNLDG